MSCRSLFAWFAAAATLSIGTAPVLAQPVLRGTISDDSTRRAIVGAEIAFDSAGSARAVSDRGGRYLLTVPAGVTSITVRAVGFRPLTAPISVSKNDTVIVDFRLTGQAVRLPDVITSTGRPATPSARMVEFERRRQFGTGAYLTRAQLAQNEGMSPSALLRVLRGMRLIRRPAACGGGYAAASLRTGSADGIKHCITNPRQTFPSGCYLAIVLDGRSIWANESPEPPNIDEFTLHNMEAIELYRGAGEIPPEFNFSGASCGVLVLWSRVGGDP